MNCIYTGKEEQYNCVKGSLKRIGCCGWSIKGSSYNYYEIYNENDKTWEIYDEDYIQYNHPKYTSMKACLEWIRDREEGFKTDKHKEAIDKGVMSADEVKTSELESDVDRLKAQLKEVDDELEKHNHRRRTHRLSIIEDLSNDQKKNWQQYLDESHQNEELEAMIERMKDAIKKLVAENKELKKRLVYCDGIRDGLLMAFDSRDEVQF